MAIGYRELMVLMSLFAVVVVLVAVWLFTIGPVLALACSLAAFMVIWVNDWPARRPQGEERFVRIEDLQSEED